MSKFTQSNAVCPLCFRPPLRETGYLSRVSGISLPHARSVYVALARIKPSSDSVTPDHGRKGCVCVVRSIREKDLYELDDISAELGRARGCRRVQNGGGARCVCCCCKRLVRDMGFCSPYASSLLAFDAMNAPCGALRAISNDLVLSGAALRGRL